ncbi:hypothetical protein Agau_C100443 [Agrobacterium tumefaciens F2]|nr:hypothetical protein Agau_C100443 [Agrobacterium tumefaciens F2]
MKEWLAFSVSAHLRIAATNDKKTFARLIGASVRSTAIT